MKPDRPRKSIGAEDTFRDDIHRLEEALDYVGPLIKKVWRYCEGNDIRGRTVAVKIKYADFKQITRSRSTATAIGSVEELRELCRTILTQEFPVGKGVRLLGVTLSSLTTLEHLGTGQFVLDF